MKRERALRPIFTRRALLLGAAEFAAFGALAARLYRMQVLQHGKYATLAKQNSVNERLLAPLRGLITDRHGAILAGNKQHWRALFMMIQTPDPASVIDRFAALISLSDAERRRIGRDISGKPRYIPVLLKDYLDWSEMARIEVHAIELPGVFVDVGASRVYPLGDATSHTIGYVARPTQVQAQANPVLALPGMRVGRAGVEQARDTVLRGSPGVVQTEVNAHGTVVRVLDRDNGTQGQTVQLTMDAGLQSLAAQKLAGQAGAAVMLDATNGEVLALASQPGFDPTLFDSGVPESVWKSWITDPKRPLNDRATAGLYAPGSTFKPNVALAALECGAITPETTFFCPGYLKLGNHTFYCWDHYGHGNVNVVSALQQSCDVFFYHTALVTGIDRIAAMGRRLGLIGRVGLDLPGVSEGFLPTRAWARGRHLVWTRGNTVIQGIGQGYTQVTPLGLATMTARIASGRAIGPHIARAVGTVAQPGSTAAHWPVLGLDDRHLAAVRQGMFEVVNTPLGTGWASRLTLPGVHMAGKTGTAQVHDETAAQEKSNFNDASLPWKFRPNAFFIAFAPVHAPRFAVAVVVEHGNEGASVSAPIAHDLITAALTRDLTAAPPGIIQSAPQAALPEAAPA
ncbi:penicillin-binding protein 2 [Acidiphilium sp. AL]|uniref:Penicillin-binding protein 2 n=1 Tax=Acidiphilium iwatense TaxID=768198 RepID=A0ABS9DXI7_9PROT|nr:MULTISPECIES: penicillin-binding protein 2 [Acidiphilium]MCF3946034.1 penicillin-binding protein 2 [Acidiphilium iwatense]MCU4159085.1 penicillin-binding protein 2 [Acidiphilium sp. AL]